MAKNSENLRFHVKTFLDAMKVTNDLMNNKMPEISAKVIENQYKQRKKWEAKIQKQSKRKPIKKKGKKRKR